MLNYTNMRCMPIGMMKLPIFFISYETVIKDNKKYNINTG